MANLAYRFILKGIFYGGFIFSSVSLLSGCMMNTASMNVANASVSVNQQLARATANQLKTMYPSAQTQFILAQPDDDYGVALEQALRTQGYAISSDDTNRSPAWTTTMAIPLIYTIDVVGGFYRITIQAGNQSLSGVFQPGTDGKIYAAGPWVRGE